MTPILHCVHLNFIAVDENVQKNLVSIWCKKLVKSVFKFLFSSSIFAIIQNVVFLVNVYHQEPLTLK